MSNAPRTFAVDAAALPSPRMRHDLLAGLPLLDRPTITVARIDAPARIGVISNPRSHLNRTNQRDPAIPAGAPWLFSAPNGKREMLETLARFAQAKIDLLIVDGGDGTVRDVITAAPRFFDRMPRLGIVPSGKTNALAIDLGIALSWSVEKAVEAAAAGCWATRAPIEISGVPGRDDALRGFLLGAGAFVRATELAQSTHRAGAFSGLAVGMSLTLAITQTFFGSATNVWRVGERMRLSSDQGEADRPFYIVLGSTLERLPLGLKPFGRERKGLKVLAVDAPPKRMALSVPALLAGSEADWLKKAGYHRGDPRSFELSVENGFILDGEHYPGGDLTVRIGEPLHFAVP
ncbi:diacylglycerol kinase [Sphingomonas koreensis]|nr:diacylglycerol kinase [Sphingomonas koreensis]